MDSTQHHNTAAAALSEFVRGLRDRLLEYVLEGTRQVEWDNAIVCPSVGLWLYAVQDNFHLKGWHGWPSPHLICGVLGTALISLGFTQAQALITNNRAARCRVARISCLTWLVLAAALVAAGLRLPSCLLALFFAGKSAIAFWNNALKPADDAALQRQARARAIPASFIRRESPSSVDYMVRSSDGKNEYRVRPSVFCTCPDFEEYGVTCKHMYRVQESDGQVIDGAGGCGNSGIGTPDSGAR
ncbi:MAG TPA: SWIM zinc finger family protein [Blastocatellia bacterium]